MEEVRELFDEKRALKVQMSKELERVSLLEEISWRQNSRALWLKEGDNKFTNVFQVVANLHR